MVGYIVPVFGRKDPPGAVRTVRRERDLQVRAKIIRRPMEQREFFEVLHRGSGHLRALAEHQADHLCPHRVDMIHIELDVGVVASVRYKIRHTDFRRPGDDER